MLGFGSGFHTVHERSCVAFAATCTDADKMTRRGSAVVLGTVEIERNIGHERRSCSCRADNLLVCNVPCGSRYVPCYAGFEAHQKQVTTDVLPLY